MNLNLSPIVKNYSKNIIQSIEDISCDDIFKDNNINNNTEKPTFIYKNKLKLNLMNMGYKTKIGSLSPTIQKSIQNN